MPNLIMRFKDGKPKALTLSYDDGVEQDEKLVSIVEKYGLKGTFNINSGCFPADNIEYAPGTIHRRMPLKKLMDVYSKSNWEIAAHAYTHASLVGLPANVASNEILQDRKELEKLFNTVIRGFAYPYGAYDDRSVEILRNCGICYARTVHSTHDFRVPQDWLRMPATCHHNDPELMKLAERFVGTEKCGYPMLFYLWGHSYEFEVQNNWEVIEEFAKAVSGKDDIWYATNIEIYDYCHAFSQLIFNTEMTICINPTSSDLWFSYCDKEVHVPSGNKITF